MSRLRELRAALGAARGLSSLTKDQQRALVEVARLVAAENVSVRALPGFDPTAVISPLASFRFAERVSVGAKASIGPYCCVWGGWSSSWARVEDGALLAPGVVLVAGNHGTVGTGWIREQPIVEQDW
jgi:hypothetical protein